MIALVTGATALVPRLARADDPAETIVVDPLGARPREDEAASASAITADRAPRGAETLADLLDAVPGVTVSRLGGPWRWRFTVALATEPQPKEP